MSFLTYTSHPVLFAASVGGVTLGVTLLLLPWKQISFGDSWSNSFLSSSGFNPSSSREPIERENNCKVVKMDIDFFPKHIKVACETRGDDGYNVLGDNWVGLFPQKLFKKVDNLNHEWQLNIKTWTKDLIDGTQEEIFETKFQSSQFVTEDYEIIGKWGYKGFHTENKSVYVVYLKEPYVSENIYFVHESKKR